MDKITEKIDSFISKQIENFEAAPLKTSFKLLFIYWVVKKIWDEVKN